MKKLTYETLRVGLEVYIRQMGKVYRIDGFAKPIESGKGPVHWNKRGQAYTLSRKDEADHAHLLEKAGLLIPIKDLLRVGKIA